MQVYVDKLPECCMNCKIKSRLSSALENVTHCCNLAEGMITLDKGFDERLPNCPLKEMPQKKENSINDTAFDYAKKLGYNECLSDIKGEKKGI